VRHQTHASADGFHAFRRAASKYSRKAGGLELAAIQLGHKRMTTTDEHYNDRDMDDLKKAAELIEGAFWKDFAPDLLRDDERGS
jgi:integrase